MTSSRFQISRRTCLRGLGVALALPLLETMGWAGGGSTSGVELADKPIRLLFLHTPYGFGRQADLKWFWPSNAKDFSPTGELSPVLTAMRSVVGDCLLIDKVDIPKLPGEGGPGHAFESGRWLTCVHPNGEPEKKASVNLGISADQVAANQLGVYTALPSLELAVRPYSLSGTTEGGYAAAYNRTLSFRSEHQALPSESSPKAVFDRLFSQRKSVRRRSSGGKGYVGAGAVADANTPSLDQSMLDLVMENSGDLRKHLSHSDQRVMDEYLDSTRALEKRVVAIERQQAEAALAATDKENGKEKSKKRSNGTWSDPIAVELPANEGGAKYSEKVMVMAELAILAFQTDITRVVTLPFSMPYDNTNYPELGFTDNHHAATHDQEPAHNLAIDRLNISLFAKIVEKMRSLSDGKGSLLDNSMVLFGSGMRDWSHNTES
ncbi:MAG TPA: DUF1552 domain-containing protein, partial [Planctomycetota bacterium]|nr:DUF1552 domain-containing protein [Planctomycetota bacterium]